MVLFAWRVEERDGFDEFPLGSFLDEGVLVLGDGIVGLRGYGGFEEARIYV